MPQSLASISVHLIWSTKNREPFIKPEIEKELFSYMAGIFRAHESPALTINGTEDHVHNLVILSRKITVAKLVEEVKKSSSKWIKTKGEFYQNFYWQSDYAALGIGQSNIPALKTYIANQKEHHRKKTFQEEYVAFLKKYGIEYDERYVWD
ncbi:MAG: IS200/IS605 family transposase [candidate division KSB1 bacterium]